MPQGDLKQKILLEQRKLERQQARADEEAAAQRRRDAERYQGKK